MPAATPSSCHVLYCLVWADTGTASQLTEKSWVSAMLFPFSNAPWNQDSPALAYAEQVPAEASSPPALALLSCTRDPLALPSQSPRAASSQLGTSCHQCPSLCRTLLKEGPAAEPEESQERAETERPRHETVLPTETRERFTSHSPLLLPLLLPQVPLRLRMASNWQCMAGAAP